MTRFTKTGEFTTEALLGMALKMLEQCRIEQVASRRKDKWLVDNDTMAAIRERVARASEPDEFYSKAAGATIDLNESGVTVEGEVGGRHSRFIGDT